jgi:CrcB protein|tara:strand:+ start:259 stop:633 length:375 start_codon:yes stop_codon:yes gene_type:complete
MDVRLIAIVAIGGALGAVLRYIIPFLISSNPMPFNTLSINLLGSLLIGVLFGALASGMALSEEMVLLIGTGFLGAFTTMSTFAFEALQVTQENTNMGFAYILATIFGSIFLAWLGYSAVIQIAS